MAMRRKHFPQRSTDLSATPAMAVSVTMSVACAVVESVVCGVWVSLVGHAPRPFDRTGFGSALMIVPGWSAASSAESR